MMQRRLGLSGEPVDAAGAQAGRLLRRNGSPISEKQPAVDGDRQSRHRDRAAIEDRLARGEWRIIRSVSNPATPSPPAPAAAHAGVVKPLKFAAGKADARRRDAQDLEEAVSNAAPIESPIHKTVPAPLTPQYMTQVYTARPSHGNCDHVLGVMGRRRFCGSAIRSARRSRTASSRSCASRRRHLLSRRKLSAASHARVAAAAREAGVAGLLTERKLFAIPLARGGLQWRTVPVTD